MVTSNWQIGDKIQGRLQIYDIKRGGMGIVYIAYDHELCEPFAIKTFQDELFNRNPQLADLFIREALIWVNLDAHPNIVRARLCQRIEGKPFLFLEYISGEDLSRWIGSRRLTLAQALRFAIQFCDGMTHALSKGIQAHRDIKPQNCLITEDGTLKVTDFGLAKAIAAVEEHGGWGGSFPYMPPEQWHDFAGVDVRADIYSFGVMLYEMLTGRRPFIVQTQTREEACLKYHKAHETQSPPSLPHALPPELRTIVETCLAKNPAHRFADFGAIREQLAECYEKLTGELPPQPISGAELTAYDLHNKAISLGHLGYYEEEIACCEQVIKLNASWANPWATKGAALLDLGRYEEAIACCDRALDLDPHYARAWLNKGVALCGQGRYKEALVCYDRALQLNPHYVKAWLDKGSTCFQLNWYEQAFYCWNQALELDPRNVEALFSKGGALGALGRYEEALTCLNHALTINPHLSEAWFNKGRVLQDLQRYEEAITCFDNALVTNPHHSQAWFFKGGTWISWAAEIAALCKHMQNPKIIVKACQHGYMEGKEAIESALRDALACFEEARRLGHPQAEQAIALCRQQLLSE